MYALGQVEQAAVSVSRCSHDRHHRVASVGGLLSSLMMASATTYLGMIEPATSYPHPRHDFPLGVLTTLVRPPSWLYTTILFRLDLVVAIAPHRLLLFVRRTRWLLYCTRESVGALNSL
jgi:hypothetical protein